MKASFFIPMNLQTSPEKISLLRRQLLEAGAWEPLHGVGHDEHALRRFLRARGGDVEAAKKMWLASMAWRDAMMADSILDERLMSGQQRDRLLKLYPHGLHGVDAMGHPV